MEHLAGVTYNDLKRIVESGGFSRNYALQLWRHYYSVYNPFIRETHETELYSGTSDIFSLSEMKKKRVSQSTDGVIKYLFGLKDSNSVESVYIPEENRLTACISSQVGCKFGCRFCATGKCGFIRNLTAAEIVEQILQIQWNLGKQITNVVYMGMGEPFDNFDEVKKSIEIISQVQGLAIAPRKITVSTAGHIPGILKMADGTFKASLAVSLHSPFKDQRTELMPGTVRYPLDELIEALEYYCGKTRKKIYFEYVLLKGVNDTPDHAAAVADILRRIPSKLNLIRYNGDNNGIYSKASSEVEDAFYYYIIKEGLSAVFRRSRGDDVRAACGQLALR